MSVYWFLDVLTYLLLSVSIFYQTKSHTHTQWLGESGPGCSAHAESCDGSTGIATVEKFSNLTEISLKKNWFIYNGTNFLFKSNFSFIKVAS